MSTDVPARFPPQPHARVHPETPSACSEPPGGAGVPSHDDVTGRLTGEATAPECLACGHPEALHDAIARRYCDATISHAATRGCICAKPAR
jgi:hypothetical protein